MTDVKIVRSSCDLRGDRRWIARLSRILGGVGGFVGGRAPLTPSSASGSGTRRGWPVSTADLPRSPGPNSRTIPAGLTNSQFGGSSAASTAAGITSSTRTVRKRATQLSCLPVNGDVIDRAPDQLTWVGWRPLGILCGKTPEFTARIANLNMKHLGIGDTCVDYPPAQRAHDIRDFVFGHGHSDQMVADEVMHFLRTIRGVRRLGNASLHFGRAEITAIYLCS